MTDVAVADPVASAPTCSALSRALGEPLAGSAPVAPGWLCIEQPGAWGRKAVTQSRLDPQLGTLLEDRGKGAGVRVGLIRRPQARGTGTSDTTTVLLAWTDPAGPWLERAELADVSVLADLDLAVLGSGVRPGLGTPVDHPLLLVCTNSKRDQCCAVNGRALVSDLTDAGVQLWESSHLGGHRFAPTGVVLPTGYAYGRWDFDAAVATLDAAAHGRVLIDHCRGRSTWTRPGQAAEMTVRRQTGDDDPSSLRCTPGDDQIVDVAHRDGRRWQVRVADESLGPDCDDPCAHKTISPTGLVPEVLA